MSSLRGQERREFSQKVRKAAFARCCRQCTVEGVENVPGVPQCESCGNVIRSGGLIYEHVDPDGLGGEPTLENCKAHCTVCADKKTHEEDNPRMRKADAVTKAAFGLKPSKRQPIKSQGFAKAKPQNRASTPIEKWRGYE